MRTKHSVMLSTAVVLAVILAAVALLAVEKAPTADSLSRVTSWTEVQAQAKEQAVPIILLVEQKHCGYCQKLKSTLFQPLANDQAYRDRALFVSVLTDFDEPLMEYEGDQISGFEFAQSLDASTTPTVLFLDSQSGELQERLVGFVEGEEYKRRLVGKIESSIRQAR